MSNSRPSAARRHTRTTEQNRDEALDKGLRITLEGDVYEVRLSDVTSNLARELRRGTGLSFNQLMNEVMTAPDVDSIAGFVWLAKRIAGERVEIDDVVVSYAQLLAEGFDVDVPSKPTEDDDPEA